MSTKNKNSGVAITKKYKILNFILLQYSHFSFFFRKKLIKEAIKLKDMETKTTVIIYIEDKQTTRFVEFKNDKPTLRDLKRHTNKDIEILKYSFIFYTTGIAVQIVDEDAILPNVDGRIFCELVLNTSSRKFKKQGKEFFNKILFNFR
jgi:hypothetical protein